MEDLKKFGINFGRYHIATNGNYYRVAKPTAEFWDYYKEHKTELKNSSISIYKHEDYGYLVYDWTRKEKASEEEIKQYKKEQQEYDRLSRCCSYVQVLMDDRDCDDTFPQCSNWDEFWNELCRVAVNAKYMWEEISEAVPPFLLS